MIDSNLKVSYLKLRNIYKSSTVFVHMRMTSGNTPTKEQFSSNDFLMVGALVRKWELPTFGKWAWQVPKHMTEPSGWFEPLIARPADDQCQQNDVSSWLCSYCCTLLCQLPCSRETKFCHNVDGRCKYKLEFLLCFIAVLSFKFRIFSSRAWIVMIILLLSVTWLYTSPINIWIRGAELVTVKYISLRYVYMIFWDDIKF